MFIDLSVFFDTRLLPGGLSRPNCSPHLFLADLSLPGQTRSKHFGSLYCLFLSSLLSFFSPLLVLSSSKSLFFISWGLFGSILGRQDDPPTLKNRAPASAAARFLKNRRLRSEGGLASVLGLSSASFGRSWGSLGGLLGSSGVLLGVSWGLLGRQETTLGSSCGSLDTFCGSYLLLRCVCSPVRPSRGRF